MLTAGWRVDSNDGEERAVILGAAVGAGISGKQESQIVGRDLEIRDESEPKGENKVTDNTMKLFPRWFVMLQITAILTDLTK